MEDIKEIKKYFVLCTADTNGRMIYLRSLHEPGRWEIVFDIDMATKYVTEEAAKMSYDFYKSEMGYDAGIFVIVPVELEYRLIIYE